MDFSPPPFFSRLKRNTEIVLVFFFRRRRLSLYGPQFLFFFPSFAPPVFFALRVKTRSSILHKHPFPVPSRGRSIIIYQSSFPSDWFISVVSLVFLPLPLFFFWRLGRMSSASAPDCLPQTSCFKFSLEYRNAAPPLVVFCFYHLSFPLWLSHSVLQPLHTFPFFLF